MKFFNTPRAASRTQLLRASCNRYSTQTKYQSIGDLRASILTKTGMDYLNNPLSYESTYNWQPYQDILDKNNKMKHLDELTDHHLLSDTPAVLSPMLMKSGFDIHRMREYRLNRMRQSLQKNNFDVGVFFDPTNIRYITDVPNMQVWIKGNPFRYVVLSADERDPVLLYDFKAAEHLGLSIRGDLFDQIYKSKVPVYFMHAAKLNEQSAIFAKDLMKAMDEKFGLKNKSCINLAIDIARPAALSALYNEQRLHIEDAYKCAEQARLIKNKDEYLCLKLSCEVANIATQRMKTFLMQNIDKPITDNEMFAILSGTNIEYGGEYLECKLLGSGQKSNPWYQESSNSEVQKDSILSFDTDMVGPFGYCADFSRAFYTGNDDTKIDSYYKTLYNVAFEQVQHNMSLIKPGITYAELQSKLWKCPQQYFDQRYTCVIHGVGSCDEYPCVMELSDGSYTGDDIIQPGTCLSVESYIGEVGGNVGVKLEDQVFVHENGIEVISTYPYEECLLL